MAKMQPMDSTPKSFPDVVYVHRQYDGGRVTFVADVSEEAVADVAYLKSEPPPPVGVYRLVEVVKFQRETKITKQVVE